MASAESARIRKRKITKRRKKMKEYKVTTTLHCRMRHTELILAESADVAEAKHEEWLRDLIGDCEITDIDQHSVEVIDVYEV